MSLETLSVIGASLCFGSFVGLKLPSTVSSMLPRRTISADATPPATSAAMPAQAITIQVRRFLITMLSPSIDGCGARIAINTLFSAKLRSAPASAPLSSRKHADIKLVVGGTVGVRANS